MKYKEVALLPNLAINNFALETPHGRMTVKKWKDVPFTVEDFSFEEYCRDNLPDILDWDFNLPHFTHDFHPYFSLQFIGIKLAVLV